MPDAQPTKPTEEQLRAWIARSWTLLLDIEAFAVPDEKAAQFELLWGLCAQAVRYATPRRGRR